MRGKEKRDYCISSIPIQTDELKNKQNARWIMFLRYRNKTSRPIIHPCLLNYRSALLLHRGTVPFLYIFVSLVPLWNSFRRVHCPADFISTAVHLFLRIRRSTAAAYLPGAASSEAFGLFPWVTRIPPHHSSAYLLIFVEGFGTNVTDITCAPVHTSFWCSISFGGDGIINCTLIGYRISMSEVNL